MKSKTITAMIIAAALLIFFFVKLSGNKQESPFSIAGDWKIDSFYTLKPGDTSIVSFLTVNFIDPKKNIIRFNADSTVKDLSSGDSTHEKYYLLDSVLYLTKDNAFVPHKITRKTSDAFTFVSPDSGVLVLKRN